MLPVVRYIIIISLCPKVPTGVTLVLNLSLRAVGTPFRMKLGVGGVELLAYSCYDSHIYQAKVGLAAFLLWY